MFCELGGHRGARLQRALAAGTSPPPNKLEQARTLVDCTPRKATASTSASRCNTCTSNLESSDPVARRRAQVAGLIAEPALLMRAL
jgi:hypothetical protein